MNQEEGSALYKILQERIRVKGALTFAEFMSSCLYEPGAGYYTSPGRKVGADGDFYTSSNVHPIFGRLIARELIQMWRTMGCPDDFQIVEAGAANGRLAADILEAVAELAPPFYQTVTYRLIEAEPSLAEVQREMLASHLQKLAWSTPAELEAGSLIFRGCMLSNELIDALPVHLVEMTAAGLREVFVTNDGDSFCEQLAPPSSRLVSNYFTGRGITLPTGARAEVRLAADNWLRTVAKALERGFILTIDYGYLAPELYGAIRQNGTLLCYYRHQVVDDPYCRAGQQDITSHVDFSALMETGAASGLTTVWFGEQYRFLMAAGMMEEILLMESRPLPESERLKDRLALKKLMLPEGGMGDTFKVLIQAKGLERPDLLCQRDWKVNLQE